MNDNIKKLGYFFLAIFSVLVLYLGYLNTVVGPKLSTDPHNRRLAAAEDAVNRGVIYDRRGIVLAEDRIINGVKQRFYPLGQKTAHLLGFVSPRYGRTGVESVFDSYLLAMDDAGKIQSMVDRLLGRERFGYNIRLTIDSNLQSRAAALMGNRRGAVVALEPRTGAVLSMVSFPSFDPMVVDSVVRTETVTRNGDRVEVPVTGYDLLKREAESAPLLNRATRGIYPPGSIFKIITGSGALGADPGNLTRTVDCKGSITVEGFQLKDTGVHGKVDFYRAMAVSCNTAFAGMGLDIGEEGLKKAARSFGFDFISYEKNGQFKGNYPVVGGEVPFNPGTLPANRMSDPEVASAAIGQGRVLVSPFQMALVAAGVANGGVVMKPAVLDRVMTRNGITIKRMDQQVLYNAVSPEVAASLTAAMEEAVKSGTGTQAAISGVRVAGKTGSAQNPHGESHAWFIGFAPVDNPRIAVAVLVENAGAGGSAAAPVAREIMREYLGI